MGRIERVGDRLPEGLDTLRAAAQDEGFRHLTRLVADWESALERFEAPGCALFAVFDAEELVGVGGLTREPTAPEAPLLRARRFYVHPAFRRRGHGEALVDAVVAVARDHADVLLVHSSVGAMSFWDAAGFARSVRPGITHELAVIRQTEAL